MKSLHNILILGTAAMLSLASCELKNELTGSLVDKEDTGAIELGVSVKQPVSQTRADVSGIDTNTYPVVIQGTSDEVTDIKYEYETLSEMPASITVPVGQYTLSSHTPGTLEKQMTAPTMPAVPTLRSAKTSPARPTLYAAWPTAASR